MKRTLFAALVLTLIMVPNAPGSAGAPYFNVIEKLVPEYVLPDPLVMQNGDPVLDARTWREKRRPEILELFEKNVYGRSPGGPLLESYKVFDEDRSALGGKAIRKQVTVDFTGPGGAGSMDMLLYLPNSGKPSPVFLLLNFSGNHSVNADPAIRIPTGWMPNLEPGIKGHRASEKGRGIKSKRFPLEEILSRGYGLATIYYGDLDPDFDDGYKNGVHPLFDDPGWSERPPDAWGSIGAWSWGLMRGLDYLETDPDVTAEKTIVLGHSRLGKAALWAGAQDERFAMVISNDSGCGGAALWRRRYGENLGLISRIYGYWFCGNIKSFGGKEDSMPVDQHMLIALIAPRPVYVASARGDKWADPRGEFLAARAADPVYRLLDAGGMDADTMPGPGERIQGSIGYHLREGKHDLTVEDWRAFMDFADIHLR